MKTSDAAAPSRTFDQQMADGYDRRNRALAPVSDNLHFLVRLILADLPSKARVLCVGAGTGAEILSLALAYPDWSFVGIDPSEEMLAVAHRRLGEAGVLDRCTLLPGYADDAPPEGFDAVVSLLVAHFVRREDRPAFYAAIRARLKPGGRFVSAEISCDLDGPVFPAMLEDWKRIQTLMGATPESLAKLGGMMRDVLGVVSPEETEVLWREGGFGTPTPFFQAFMIRGWHAVRN